MGQKGIKKSVKILFMQNGSKTDKQFVEIYFWVKKLQNGPKYSVKQSVKILFLQNGPKNWVLGFHENLYICNLKSP